MKRNVRAHASVERDLYKKVGFGAWLRRGCTGYSYGEPGSNEFFDLTILLLLWELKFHVSWKGRRNGYDKLYTEDEA